VEFGKASRRFAWRPGARALYQYSLYLTRIQCNERYAVQRTPLNPPTSNDWATEHDSYREDVTKGWTDDRLGSGCLFPYTSFFAIGCRYFVFSRLNCLHLGVRSYNNALDDHFINGFLHLHYIGRFAWRKIEGTVSYRTGSHLEKMLTRRNRKKVGQPSCESPSLPEHDPSLGSLLPASAKWVSLVERTGTGPGRPLTCLIFSDVSSFISTFLDRLL